MNIYIYIGCTCCPKEGEAPPPPGARAYVSMWYTPGVRHGLKCIIKSGKSRCLLVFICFAWFCFAPYLSMLVFGMKRCSKTITALQGPIR